VNGSFASAAGRCFGEKNDQARQLQSLRHRETTIELPKEKFAELIYQPEEI
jgi:hypothetical protein